MRKIIKMRWFILAVWIVAVALSIVYSPDLNKVLRAKGQQFLSDDNPSMKADKILKKMDKTPGNADIIVFNGDNKLTSSQMNSIKNGVNNIKNNSDALGVSNLLDPFNLPDIKSKLISKDGKTIMVSFKLNKKDREVSDIKKQLDDKLKNVKVKYYLTGTDFISDDYIRTVSSGVDKSAVLTVLFILIVLIIMFRSIITPLISLFAVIISYIVSLAIVGQLVYRFNYPISSLTQMVIILVLFGVGTDYNILLFNRFKEEMASSSSIDEAIVNTYKTAGKTIAFSILTVFIAFLSLTLAKFGLYRSGNCVAIAVVVLLLEILTLTPFIMKTLGTKLFWPSKKVTKHKPSKAWGNAASFSIKRPIIVSIVTILILVPTIYFNTQKYSYDTVNEIGDSVPSVKGFDLITKNFGKGEALTTTVVLENNKAMDNTEALSVIDNLTNKLKDIKGVKSVSSVTQPLSDPIDLMYLGKQTEGVTDGISKSKDGVDTISGGLNQINTSLGSINLNDLSKVDELAVGTGKVQDGLNAVTLGLKQVNAGIAQGAAGADKISAGIEQAQNGMTQITTYTKQISDGVGEIQNGYVQLGTKYGEIANGVSGLQNGLDGMNNTIGALSKIYKFDNDPRYTNGVELYYSNLSEGITKLNSGLNAFKENYDILTGKLGTVNQTLNQINESQKQLLDGLNQLQNGSTALASGLRQGSTGQSTIIDNMSKLNAGLDQVKTGQTKLNSMLGTLGSSVPQLKDALSKSSNGLNSVSGGLEKTNDYLEQLNESKDFFAPKEMLSNDSIKQSLDMYMTKDRKIVKFTVVLDSDPYSAAAMNTSKEINDTIPGAIKGTVLKDAKYGTSGTSASDYDLNKVALNDLNTIKIIVLISVFIVLLIVIRSPLISLYISLALMAAYYISSTSLNIIVFHIFKLDGVSWNVPFFSFVMIVALGVDYSIFLMMRFKEYKDISQEEAIVLASKNIGGIVMSAALILGGTFVTLIPAGVRLLTQLAIAVVIGLIALSIILLPILLPALIALPKAINNKTNDNNYDDTDITA